MKKWVVQFVLWTATISLIIPPGLVSAANTINSISYQLAGTVHGCGVMQGGASDGTNLFFACADSQKNIRIVKTSPTGQILAKGPTLSRKDVGHVNDMAYNSKTKLLVLCAEDWQGNSSLYSVVRFVDPATLELTATKKKLSDGTGASNICYNPATDQYVVRGKIFDADFKYTNKRVYTSSDIAEDTDTNKIEGTVLVQGTECDSTYIYTMRVVWGQNGYNMVSVYDWSGKNAGVYKVNINDEGENVILVGNTLYMGINEGGMSKGGNAADDYFVALHIDGMGAGCEPDGSENLVTNAFKAKNNAYFTGGTCCNTTPTGLGQAAATEGSKAQEKLLRFFTGKGFTLAQAAGIAGNVQKESSFNPEAKNSSSGAYGLFQWLGSRYSNNKKGVDSLVEYAAQNNLNVSDVDAQLGFAWLEINTTEKPTLVAFASNMNMTVKEAAETWSIKFERSGATNHNDRIKFAQEIYAAFKGTIPDGTGIDVKGITPDSATAGSSTTSTCSNLNATTCTPHEPIGDRGADQHAAIFGKYEDQSNWVPVNKFMDFTFKTKSASSGALINKKAEPCLRAVENELQTATKYPVWSFMCSRIGEGRPDFYHGYAAACDINPSKSGKGNGCGFCDGWGTNNHDIPDDWVDIFEKYGWYWGGHWGGGTNGDWMHFQYEGDQSDANGKRTPGAV